MCPAGADTTRYINSKVTPLVASRFLMSPSPVYYQTGINLINLLNLVQEIVGRYVLSQVSVRYTGYTGTIMVFCTFAEENNE